MIGVHKFSIGMTSAIVTSMGLIAGLAPGSNTKTSITAGLLIFAIADNISDSLGIHIYKESEGATRHEIALSTFGNFFARLILSFTFILIVLLLPPDTAFMVSSVWGLILLTGLSYLIAKAKNTRPLPEIIYHLIIALVVIIGSKLLGNYISNQIAGQ
jgi:vacuolar iron transporter family protein